MLHLWIIPSPPQLQSISFRGEPSGHRPNLVSHEIGSFVEKTFGQLHKSSGSGREPSQQSGNAAQLILVHEQSIEFGGESSQQIFSQNP